MTQTQAKGKHAPEETQLTCEACKHVTRAQNIDRGWVRPPLGIRLGFQGSRTIVSGPTPGSKSSTDSRNPSGDVKSAAVSDTMAAQ